MTSVCKCVTDHHSYVMLVAADGSSAQASTRKRGFFANKDQTVGEPPLMRPRLTGVLALEAAERRITARFAERRHRADRRLSKRRSPSLLVSLPLFLGALPCAGIVRRRGGPRRDGFILAGSAAGVETCRTPTFPVSLPPVTCAPGRPSAARPPWGGSNGRPVRPRPSQRRHHHCSFVDGFRRSRSRPRGRRPVGEGACRPPAQIRPHCQSAHAGGGRGAHRGGW